MTKRFVLFPLLFLFFIACNNKNSSEVKLKVTSGSDSAFVSSLLDSSLYFIDKPGSEKADLDSASALMHLADSINKNSVHNEFLTGKTDYNYSKLYKANNNNDSGKMYIGKAIAVLKKFNHHALLGNVYMDMGEYYDILDKTALKERIKYTENALEQFRLDSLKEKQADALRVLGDLNQFDRNAGLAFLQLNESLKLYKEVGTQSLQGLYDLLCSVSTDMGDPAKGVEYGLLAVKTAEQQHDTTLQLCTIYNRLAVAYSFWPKDGGECATYLKKALAIAQKYNDIDAITTVLLNVCYMPHGRGDFKEFLNLIKSSDKILKHQELDDSVYFAAFYLIAYTFGEKNNEATLYANRLLKMIAGYDWDNVVLAPVYTSLSRYYLWQKDYVDAEKYATTFIAFCRKNKYRNTLATAYLFRSEADSGLANFPAALMDFKKHKIIKDSLMDESKSRQIGQLQIRYETEKKDRDIEFQKQNIDLLTNKSEVEKDNLKKTRTTRDVIAFSSILLLGLAYFAYRIKQRHNKKLELQKEEIDKQNTQLKKLMGEKEWLVKEIHHRVKNNLQIMTSLMNIQSNYLEKGVALDAIKASQSRMNAMSLIHEKLYQSSSLVSINMHKYITELCTYLVESFGGDKNVAIQIDADEVDFDVSQAVPLGLILNEAITNAIKYAFVGNKNNCLNISLISTGDDLWTLEIRDNGKGLPSTLQFRKSNSIGITLMETLTEQLNGKMDLKNDGGLKISITFAKLLTLKNPVTPSYINQHTNG